MKQYVIGILDRIFAVIGALLCSQVPLFIKQYTLRLGGHVTELRFQVNTLSRAAEASNKTLQEYIEKFIINGDPDISKQGAFMQGMIDRLGELSHSLLSLENCSVFSKPFIFFYQLDMSIVSDTIDSFQPGIIFSTESFIYSLFGILIGCLLFKIIGKCYSLVLINN